LQEERQTLQDLCVQGGGRVEIAVVIVMAVPPRLPISEPTFPIGAFDSDCLSWRNTQQYYSRRSRTAEVMVPNFILIMPSAELGIRCIVTKVANHCIIKTRQIVGQFCLYPTKPAKTDLLYKLKKKVS